MSVTVALLETFEQLENFNFSSKNKYLILCTENSKIDIEILNKKAIEYYGAIFPKLIFKDEIVENGYLIFILKADSHIEFIENMHLYDFKNTALNNYNTLITIIDGLSEYNVSFLENMFEYTNLNSSIIGGGAGSFKKNRKHLFNKNGFFSDSSIIVMVNNSIDIAVSDGWQVLDGPFVVTSSEGKAIKELDYKSALELYKSIIEKDLNRKLEMKDFYTLMKDYPLGIVKNEDKYILRDPIYISQDTIHLAGDIENSSVVNILKAKQSDLLKSTFETRNKVLQNGAKHLMIFECVSRLEYLSASTYIKELKKLDTNSIKTIFGVISIGEIANSGEDYISLLNKSCVIGGICH